MMQEDSFPKAVDAEIVSSEEQISEDGVSSFSRLVRVGRPPFDVTDENRALVTALRINGVTEEEISDTLGIDPKTLRKHFREELDHGKRLAVGKVARALYLKAIKADTGDSGAVTAAIFLLKTQGRWREEEAPQAPAQTINILALLEPEKLRELWLLAKEQRRLEGGDE